jgi:ubiquitin-conjugating enzyme E2 S
MAATNENISPKVMVRLMGEIKELQKQPIDGVRVIMNDENITDIQCDITGPQGTPYESGVFRMKLALGADFPTAPPKAFFVTRIFHPNVSTEGEICVNTLKKDWSPNLGIKHIITVIRCLLIDPNPESALNEEAGRLLLEEYEDFAQQAKLMTEIHAAKSMAGGDSDCKDAGAAPHGPSAAKKRATEKKKSERKKSLKRL